MAMASKAKRKPRAVNGKTHHFVRLSRLRARPGRSSDQGIEQDERGQDQPKDKKRAQENR
jgi:hypothetical protein